MKILKLAGFTLKTLVVISHCLPGEAHAVKKVLNVGIQRQIDSLDPIYYDDIPESYLGNNLFETLIARDPKTGQLVPRAAQSFSVSPDGLKILFTLRPDLRWTDGKKITAKDFEYSLRRILDPVNQSPHREKLMAISGAEELATGGMILPAQLGIFSESESKIRIELKRPSSSILNAFTQPWSAVVPKASVDRYLKKWTEVDHWIGSGVFMPSSVSGERIVLVKNPFHRFKSILQVDEIAVHLMKTREEGLGAYMSGRVHLFGHRDFDMPDEAKVRLRSASDVVAQPDFLCSILRLNTAKVPFSHEKLRQAIAMGIDRELLLSGLGSKGEKPAYSIVPEKILSYDPPSTFLYSASRARKLLSSIGYCTREGETGCNELPMVEMIFFGNEKNRKMALSLSVMFKQGLGWKNMGIKEMSQVEFLKSVSMADYTLALDEIAVLPEHPFGFLDAFRKDRSSSGGFVHREFERILDAAELTTEWSEAKALFRNAEGILMQDGGIIPLYHGATYILVSPKVRGFVPNIWDDHPFSLLGIR